MERIVGNTRLVLVEGDITRQEVDAIVNAANSSLQGGGGVDGAIHRAGGPQILAECRAIVVRQGACPPGRAVVTSGGRLKSRHVIHAVGPVWRDGHRGEDDCLRSAYLDSLRQAVTVGARSLAFPSISTGAYGFPIERAARIAVETVRHRVREGDPFDEVRFVAFSRADYLVYQRLLESV